VRPPPNPIVYHVVAAADNGLVNRNDAARLIGPRGAFLAAASVTASTS